MVCEMLLGPDRTTDDVHLKSCGLAYHGALGVGGGRPYQVAQHRSFCIYDFQVFHA